jgi:2-keto-3-deoxy-6-phosphogluconate aldolase
MTVPGAVGLIGQLAKSLPAGIVLGAGTVTDARPQAPSSTPGRGSSSLPSSVARS